MRTEFELESGGTVIVESLGSVVQAAGDIMQGFKALPRMPEEIEVSSA